MTNLFIPSNIAGRCKCQNPSCSSHVKLPNGVQCTEGEVIRCGFCARSKTGGLGDLISNVLSKLGITEKTVNRWLGIQEGCGCNKRKKFLNTILPLRKKE